MATENSSMRANTGLDGITPQFLKDGADILKLTITHMVNLSINSCIVSSNLKTARVTPFYKKESQLEVGNYRPVNVVSTVC